LAKPANQIRTNLYLSRRVWGLLKTRAFDERTTNSTLIDFVLRAYLKNRNKDLQKAEVALHRKHDGGEDRKPRAVYIDPILWSQFQELARVENVSAASLAESLLVDYLTGEDTENAEKLESQSEQGEPAQLKPEERDPKRYVRVGDEVFDIGETPIIINMNKEESQED
jgi:hypothetical protein